MSFQLRLPFNKLLFLTCILNASFAVEVSAIDVTDEIVGIYLFDDYGKNEYLTIHQNKDQYIAINISRHLIFLKSLALIGFGPSIEPPETIEEFTITFSSALSATTIIASSKVTKYLVKPLVPRNTKEETRPYNIPRIISFLERDGIFYACLQSEPPDIDVIGHCYKKIF